MAASKGTFLLDVSRQNGHYHYSVHVFKSDSAVAFDGYDGKKQTKVLNLAREYPGFTLSYNGDYNPGFRSDVFDLLRH